MNKSLEQIAIEGYRKYHPADNGIHVCRVDEIGNNFYTEVNILLPHKDVDFVYQSLKAEFYEKNLDAQDLIVDMCKDGSTWEDFPVSRQMLPRMLEAAAKVRKIENTREG